MESENKLKIPLISTALVLGVSPEERWWRALKGPLCHDMPIACLHQCRPKQAGELEVWISKCLEEQTYCFRAWFLDLSNLRLLGCNVQILFSKNSLPKLMTGQCKECFRVH